MSKIQVFRNISQLLSMKGVVKKQGRHTEQKDLGVIKNGALVVESGKVAWVGAESRLPSQYQRIKARDCQGLNLFPGFVDCHTHMVFAGNRQHEFELRNQGVSYQEIAEKGGGILSTVKATRKASLEELSMLAQKRVDKHLAQGVTTIEIKSGYGLNTKSEEKMLMAARQLKKARVVTTFLGAHAIPKEFSGEADYLIKLKRDLKRIKDKGLSQRVDIFVEKGYFSEKLSQDYLQFARSLGFEITIHADQLNRTRATQLAVEMKAQSADHVICANKTDRQKLADSETVAVLLPAADFYLQCAYPDARDFIDRGACVALATDFNPGSSPTQNLSFVGLLARLKMQMSLPEVFAALTYGGAKALGLENVAGALLPGYSADFFLSSLNWDQFFYGLEENSVEQTFVRGKKV